MNSRMPIRLIMLRIYGKMFKMVSIRRRIAIEALTSLKILMIRKPRITDVVELIDPPVPTTFMIRPKLVPNTMKQSKTFQP